MEYILGENDIETHVDTADSYKDAIMSMFEQAQHNLDIFTQNLEPEIFNNSRVEQSVLRLAKRHSNTCVRILVNDSTSAVQNGHCLIRLAQQLTSSVFIHNPSIKQKVDQSAFIVADKTGLIIRSLAKERNYNASINFKSPRAAANQLELFDEGWEHSTPDMQTRRIYI